MAAIDNLMQAISGGWTQHARFLRLTTSLGADTLVAESMHGWEAVDHGGFRLELTALASDPKLPVATLIGAPVLLEWLRASGGSDYRPFHGHVAAAELLGYNGGLARFRLVLEPWLASLRQSQDSYAYQDATVVEISEQIFGYLSKGVEQPAWRWELADRAKYLKRSLTAQQGETHFAFLARLWAEEGIFYWFEHEADPGSPAFGKHTLVLADANQAFEPSSPDAIPYHAMDVVEPTGIVREFMAARRWRIGQVARASWDYRSRSTRSTGASANQAVAPGQDRDVAGPYAYQTASVGSQRSQQQLDALRVQAYLSEGTGTAPRMAPGLRFALTGHPTLGAADAFLCLRVQHSARANLDADLQSAIEQRLGQLPAMLDADHASGPDPAIQAPLHADSHRSTGLAQGQAEVYRNRFLALPATRTYRPAADAGHGTRLHADGVAEGAQTAIVVGDGNPIHTDRDHRLRTQAHWQRGQNSASWEDHPFQANAPADQGAGTYTRMLTPVGGDNWGGVAVPRVGQELWTEALEGQADRPVAIASVYNGQGSADAQHNSLSGGPSNSTANAAAWFAGNTHAAVLTGIKSQDLSLSQSGTGGYRQLQIDDTPQQARAQLYTTDHQSALTLGHVKQTSDNQRQADRGYGAELATEAYGALRGGKGLLISSAAGASQMDASAPLAELAQSQQRVRGLIDAAQKQGAGLAPPSQDGAPAAGSTASAPPASGATGSEPPPEQVPAVAGLQQIQEALGATKSGSTPDQAIGGGAGNAAAWSKPLLVAHGADGVAAMSGQSHVWVSGKDTVLSAGQDLQLLNRGKASLAVTHGLALYVQGGAADSRPVKTQGIALHAASGAVQLQAQNGGNLSAQAQQAVTLASTAADALLQAKEQLLLNAAGAYLKMQGGDIELGGPGKVEFHGATHELAGPQSSSLAASTAQSEPKLCELRTRSGDANGSGTMKAA